jgi:hypothetical protein
LRVMAIMVGLLAPARGWSGALRAPMGSRWRVNLRRRAGKDHDGQQHKGHPMLMT